jgi:hypothetical protein
LTLPQADTSVNKKKKPTAIQSGAPGEAALDPIVSEILANAPLLADIIRNALTATPSPVQVSAPAVTGGQDANLEEPDFGDADPLVYNVRSTPSRSTGPAAIYCKPRSFRSLITPTTRARIYALGYVELSDLLPVGEIKVREEFNLLQRADGGLAIGPKKQPRILRDVTEWSLVFNRYASVLLETHPQLAVDLADYQAFIFSLARDYHPPNLAIAYDKEFRSEFAQSVVEFAEPHNRDLFARIFHQAPITFCGLCRSRSHKTESCSTHGGRSFPTGGSSRHSPGGGGREGQTCHSWNLGECSSKFGEGRCRYPHKCDRCSGAHKSRDCKERKNSDR